jgi:hypothetical protein
MTTKRGAGNVGRGNITERGVGRLRGNNRLEIRLLLFDL